MIEVPYNITLIASTTTSLKIGWTCAVCCNCHAKKKIATLIDF